MSPEAERDERMEELTAAIAANVAVRNRDAAGPSLHAKVALWVGVINSGGLMLLGGYCLKAAVDHSTLFRAAATIMVLGTLVLVKLR